MSERADAQGEVQEENKATAVRFIHGFNEMMASKPGTRQSRWTAARDIIFGGCTIAGTVIASPLLRRRYNRHGATDAEAAAGMPGDNLVKQPKLGYTRAITIEAPPAQLWPWLAQIGQGRGGLYSYDGLENLVGCDIHSADNVLAEHQDLNEGDIIRSGPDKFPCWMVMDIKAPRHLVLLGAGTPAQIAVPDVVDEIPAKDYAASTWQWQLLPRADETQTRLVVRQRLTFSPGQRLIWRLVEPVNFAMEHKMLEGLKARAEAHAPFAEGDASVSTYDVTDTAVVGHPRDEVYAALVAELNGTTSWWLPHRATTVREGHSYDDAGAVADTIVRGRWAVPFTTMTMEVQPGELIRVHYVGGAFKGTGTWTFTDIDRRRTEVTYRWQTSPSGPLRRALARFLPVAKTHSTNMRTGFQQLTAFLDRKTEHCAGSATHSPPTSG